MQPCGVLHCKGFKLENAQCVWPCWLALVQDDRQSTVYRLQQYVMQSHANHSRAGLGDPCP